MTTVWRKLNLKEDAAIGVLDAPQSFEAEIDALGGVRVARDTASMAGLTFLIAFVTKLDDIEATSESIAGMDAGDVTVWLAYPKKSSKRYTCEFSRDTGWEPLGRAGFEGVRQVAIDEDWSAIRFRRVEFIKTMKRDPKRALTDEGRAR